MSAVTPAVDAPVRRRLVLSEVPTSFWPFAVFAVLFLVGGMLRPSLFSLAGLWTTAAFAMILAIVSAGQTLAIVQGGIDLSIPNTLTTAALAYLTLTDALGAVGALVAALAIGTAIGLANGAGIALLRISPIVMTIAMNGLLFGVLLLVFDLSQLSNVPALVTALTSDRLDVLGTSIPAVVVLGLALILALQALLSLTGWGRDLYLVGSAPDAARLAGLPVPAIRMSAYALSGALAAFGGIVVAGYFAQTSVGMGDPYLLGSVAAVVVGGASIFGGTGSMIGTLGGALVLGQVQTLVSIANLGVNVQQILYGLLVLVVVALYGRERAR